MSGHRGALADFRHSILLVVLLSACGRYPIPTQPAPVKVVSAPYKYILPVISCHPCAPMPPTHGAVDTDNSCDTLAAVGARWTYNYSTTPLVCAGVESVPMIQSGAQISNTLGGNSEWILGFNEPDLSCPQCWAYQTPSDAAQNWRLIEQAYPDKKLVSPSPISGQSYDVLGWLGRFRQAYFDLYGEYPRLDALGVHIYFYHAADALPVVRQAEQLAREWSVSGGVWVTEFGMALGDPGNEEKTFLDWLQTSGAARYAWFGSSINTAQGIEQGWYGKDWVDMSLVKGGKLTGFGSIYAGYR